LAGCCVGKSPNRFLMVTLCLENLSSGENRAVEIVNQFCCKQHVSHILLSALPRLTWMSAFGDASRRRYLLERVDSVAILISIRQFVSLPP
jgi:hypothetical protein